jgi:TonB-dependent SusC/RagA subfamily outer membrane receptor
MVARRFFMLLASTLAVATPLFAQQSGTVTGRVTDATQQPVVGVNVVVSAAADVRADRGTITDAQGRYRLTGVPAGARVVRVVGIGYRESTRSITVQSGQTVTADFTLETDAVALSELVVVGYGTQRAGNVTGAVKQVTSEEFNTGRIVSPEMLIQSKVPGVQVVDNNEPGGGLSVRIRGATSINASSDPLYVVDGVPLGSGSGGGLSAGRNALNFINPQDIESITVLKDAAAASIYGANASNGVVLITTKTARRRLRVVPRC